MPTDEHYRKLERLYRSASINEYYRPILHIEDARAEVRIQVEPRFFHAADAVHGSVYFKALDDAAFFAVNSLVDDVLVLTASFNIYLLRPISDGEVKAVGRVIHRSRRLFVAQADLVDTADRKLAHGTGSFMRSDIRLTPEVGYV